MTLHAVAGTVTIGSSATSILLLAVFWRIMLGRYSHSSVELANGGVLEVK